MSVIASPPSQAPRPQPLVPSPKPLAPLFVFGYPSDCGGASTELWSLVRLWRRHGRDVTLIPTWTIPTGWQERVAAVGCRTLRMKPAEVALPDGSLVVSLCNAPFLAVAERLKNCRLVYLPCMNRLNGALEEQTLVRCGRALTYVFQSQYQADALAPQIEALGVTKWIVIPGAFELADFPFRPRNRREGEPFVFGRISRPDPRKYTADWWQFCEHARLAFHCAGIELRCRVMGWNRIAARNCGRPPDWVEVLPKCAEPTAEFLGTLDCLVQFGDEVENWPRVGLEAMAAGVPIIADDRGGWREMLDDEERGERRGERETAHAPHHTPPAPLSMPRGFLVDVTKRHDGIIWLLYLAKNERQRLHTAAAARRRVEMLTDENYIWQPWQKLFAILQESGIRDERGKISEH